MTNWPEPDDPVYPTCGHLLTNQLTMYHGGVCGDIKAIGDDTDTIACLAQFDYSLYSPRASCERDDRSDVLRFALTTVIMAD